MASLVPALNSMSKVSTIAIPTEDCPLCGARLADCDGKSCSEMPRGKNVGLLEQHRRARMARENVEVQNHLDRQAATNATNAHPLSKSDMPSIRTLQDLSSALGQLDYEFDDPDIDLEQYHTPPDLAARFLWTAKEDLVGRSVADLGCGCGILGIGATFLGAHKVMGFEIDESAAAKARKNASNGQMEVTVCDVKKGIDESHYLQYDTVITNPPFGTRQKKADLKFLSTALKLSKRAVYSLHKSSTQEYLLDRAKRWGLEGKILAEIKYPLPKTYAMHRQDGVTKTRGVKGADIEVCLLQLIKPASVMAAEAAANPHLCM